MTSEEQARQAIDQQLTAGGRIVQGHTAMSLRTGLGAAVREVPLTAGKANCPLYADGKITDTVKPHAPAREGLACHRLDTEGLWGVQAGVMPESGGDGQVHRLSPAR